jgi:tape measure domain-containing protein
MGSSGISIGTIWLEIEARMDQAMQVLEDFGHATDGFIQEQQNKWKSLENIGSGFLQIGAGLTAGITAPLTGLGVAAVGAAEGINTAKVAFTTMLGSGEKADAMLKDLQSFAATTPFEFTDLVSAAQRMKTLGFSAEQIIPTLRTIGDTVAASGEMSKEKIDGITTALGQMQLKGKVSAEEMSQLSERGVDAWGALAKAAGVTVPEAMKLAEKGAFDASEAVPAILAGMAEKAGGSMEAMSKTLTGQWSNFKDTITQALIPIGQALIPALQSLLPILTSVLDKVVEGAKWFSDLPEPIKNSAIALAAMAAAAGPLIGLLGAALMAFTSLQAALAPLGFTIISLTAAIGPWVIAIGAALAALVALGTWVYQNWDPIVAVLTQAWDGLTEAWGAVWGLIQGALITAWNAIAGAVNTVWQPIKAFFSTIWDAIGPYFVGAWNAIAGALSSVWDGIKSVATTVWNWVIGLFDKFIDAAKKIPGAAKFFNLDDAWGSVKKLGAETKGTTTEVKKAAVEFPKMTVGASDVGKATKKAADDGVKPLHFHINALEQAIKDEQAALLKGHQDFKKWADAHKDAESQIPKLTAVSDELNASITRIIGSMKNVPPAFVDAETQAKTSMQGAVDKVRELDTAYKDLGIKSSASVAQTATDYTNAYNTIKNSGTATARDIDAAWVAMETARQNAAIAAGDKIPAEQLRALNKMKEQLDGELPKQTSAWEGFSTQVSTVITNFAQDIGKSLFEGDTSWGEKCKGLLKSLGSAVVSSFIEPATAALTSFIQGVLKDLINDLGKTLGLFKDVGTEAAKVGTGAASDAAGGVSGGIPGGGGGGIPSGGGGGGGALSSFLSGGLLGNILAAGQLGMSVFQSFQFAAMNKSLDLIEHNTRYSMMYLGERKDGGILGVLFRIQENTQFLQGQLDIISGQQLGPMQDVFTRIESPITIAAQKLTEILLWEHDTTNYQRLQLDAITQAIRENGSWLERLSYGQEKLIQVTVTGSDPNTVAAKVAAQLRLQGATA